MISVVDCHTEVLGSNPGGPKDFPLGITSLVNCTASVPYQGVMGVHMHPRTFFKISMNVCGLSD